MMCLHNHFNLLVCEVPNERSEEEITGLMKPLKLYCKHLRDININVLQVFLINNNYQVKKC